MAEKKKLEWMNVDQETLKGDKLWDAFIKANEEAGKKFDAFKEAFIAKAREKKALADDQTLKFNYQYNKLGVAKDSIRSSATFKL
jgi:hypothetical protein